MDHHQTLFYLFQYILKIIQRTFSYQFIGNATFSVDTFFFISGLLVTLLFLRGENKDKTITTLRFTLLGLKKWSMLIFYRFVRLTPAYLFAIVFTELSFKASYNKSVFSTGVFDDVTCGKFWWRNVLYINNWFPFQEFCMIWSWYLANDMQFYIVAALLLVFLTRYVSTICLITRNILLIGLAFFKYPEILETSRHAWESSLDSYSRRG